ncbi:hypothetical protein [Micromonospora sp. NPDC005299]|uniref:hypothetical protein n=1 Tax=Micromonospora sp. NPDC005299 TaxID=3364231 RepID=UPI0036AD403F
MTTTTTDPQSVVDDFNATNGSVTWVAYWTGTRDDAPKYNLTDGKAWLLGGHTPVVRVRGESSCIALTHIDVLPGQPDDIDDDSRDLPSPVRAAARVREYISANGDGIYDVIDGNLLYARDLESLRRAGDQVGNLVMEADKLRAQVAELADKLHKADTEVQRLTRDNTAHANENDKLRKVVEAVESLLMVTDGDPLGDLGIAIPLDEIRRVLGKARGEVAK